MEYQSCEIDPIKASQFQKPNLEDFWVVSSFKPFFSPLEKPPRQWDEVLMDFSQIFGLVTAGIASAVNHCN